MTVASEATLLEGLQSTGVALPRVMHVRPAVADTSALVSDVMMSVRHDMPSPLLLSMRIGVVRCFIAHHVWAEVPRKLASIGDEGRLDFPVAERLWWDCYVPLVRVVDASSLPPATDGARLDERDESDGPAALLHDLIAPVVSLSTDRDLIDLGLAHGRWRLAAKSGHEIAQVAQAAWGANAALNLTVDGAARAARTARSLLSQQWVQVLAILVVAGLFLTRDRWAPTAQDRTRRLRDAAPGLGQALSDGLVELRDRLDDAYEVWDTAMTGRQGLSADHEIARLLASSPPLTAREIVEALNPDASQPEIRKALPSVRHTLAVGSGFVEIRRGRWQLGRAGSLLA